MNEKVREQYAAEFAGWLDHPRELADELLDEDYEDYIVLLHEVLDEAGFRARTDSEALSVLHVAEVKSSLTAEDWADAYMESAAEFSGGEKDFPDMDERLALDIIGANKDGYHYEIKVHDDPEDWAEGTEALQREAAEMIEKTFDPRGLASMIWEDAPDFRTVKSEALREAGFQGDEEHVRIEIPESSIKMHDTPEGYAQQFIDEVRYTHSLSDYFEPGGRFWSHLVDLGEFDYTVVVLDDPEDGY